MSHDLHRPSVLVTGADGFLARAVCPLLAGRAKVIALVRAAADTPRPGVTQVCTALNQLTAAPDAILHLAARIPRLRSYTREELDASNVGLLNALLERFPTARHVLASSVSVYGHPTGLPLCAETPVMPNTDYGRSKLAAEERVAAAGDHAIIRFASLIGVGMPSGSFIPAAVTAARSGRIPVVGDGSRLQNYLDIEDAARQCQVALDRPGNFVALGVSSRSASNLEVARLLAERTGAQIVHCSGDQGPSFVYATDARSDLGRAHSRPLSATLDRMLNACTS